MFMISYIYNTSTCTYLLLLLLFLLILISLLLLLLLLIFLSNIIHISYMSINTLDMSNIRASACEPISEEWN